jgi:hypothetical protein
MRQAWGGGGEEEGGVSSIESTDKASAFSLPNEEDLLSSEPEPLQISHSMRGMSRGPEGGGCEYLLDSVWRARWSRSQFKPPLNTSETQGILLNW